MPVTYREDDDTRTAEISVSGRITSDDFDRIATPLQAFIDRHGTIGFIEVIEDLGGFDLSMITKGVRFDLKNLSSITHCAVVTDIGWISPVARTAGSLVSTRLRMFPMDRLDEARSWARDPSAGTL